MGSPWGSRNNPSHPGIVFPGSEFGNPMARLICTVIITGTTSLRSPQKEMNYVRSTMSMGHLQRDSN